MTSQYILRTFCSLGCEFSRIVSSEALSSAKLSEESFRLKDLIDQSQLFNRWFIPQFVKFSINAWAQALTEEKIDRWIRQYRTSKYRSRKPRTVLIVMAGNVPMAGLHDLLCTLAAGHHALIKLSSADDKLIPAVIDVLARIAPDLKNRICYSSGPVKDFNAIIATGSNNTSRYFEYYFGNYPHIIRRNRNSVAVITGNETEDDLRKLADDIMLYFGLGCRNVSKLYMPKGYKIENLFPSFESYSFVADHNKYRNNFDYQKSIMLINGIPHHDNGFLLFREADSLITPVAVLHYELYNSLDQVKIDLKETIQSIQCIISTGETNMDAIFPGGSQFPELWDYSDSIDTMKFLLELD